MKTTNNLFVRRWRKILIIPSLTLLLGLVLLALGADLAGEYWYKAGWVLSVTSLHPFLMIGAVEIFLWLSAPGYVAEVERRQQARLEDHG